MSGHRGRGPRSEQRLTYGDIRRRLVTWQATHRPTTLWWSYSLAATGVARLSARLRDHVIARNIELPADLADWLLTLATDADHLRDAVHDAGLDPSDSTVSPRLTR